MFLKAVKVQLRNSHKTIIVVKSTHLLVKIKLQWCVESLIKVVRDVEFWGNGDGGSNCVLNNDGLCDIENQTFGRPAKYQSLHCAVGYWGAHLGSPLGPLWTESSGAGGAKRERVLALATVTTVAAPFSTSRLAEQHGWPVAAADLCGASEPGHWFVSNPVVQVSVGPREDPTCFSCHYTCTHHSSTRGDHSSRPPDLLSSTHGCQQSQEASQNVQRWWVWNGRWNWCWRIYAFSHI